MPRYIRTTVPPQSRHKKLVATLARELGSPGNALQPVILEDHLRVTKCRHVYVIWDKWKALDHEERWEVIFQAYRQAEGEEVAAEIMLASGVTSAEALAHGLYPYKVEVARRRSDKPLPEAYREAIAAEAAHTLMGARARELRYVRLEDAEQAVKRLQKALPASTWRIVKDDLYED